jgi:uncharacterized protein
MHDFGDMDEVERVLESLAEREAEPLVARASRGRWAHLFGGAPDLSEPEAAVPVGNQPGLAARVETLEREIDQIKQEFERFRRQFE